MKCCGASRNLWMWSRSESSRAAETAKAEASRERLWSSNWRREERLAAGKLASRCGRRSRAARKAASSLRWASVRPTSRATFSRLSCSTWRRRSSS
ncbi:Hypothetical predicted protein [Cloeon dipterum]|uniref:Uncharacterized protein n=1 Tax=Cloeon dipterum TaxID=197152 RepID=A0A8S1CMN9_9INSE|nr:Hypothetical predicted protein [Cloeon dipterum]